MILALMTTVMWVLIREGCSMFLCMPPKQQNPFDLGRLTASSEVVVTGRVVEIIRLPHTTLLVKALVEVDCTYKTSGAQVPVVIEVHGVSTQYESCLSVVKLNSRYIFFLSRTSNVQQYNVHNEQLQSGAVKLKGKTDLSGVLEACYKSSYQPTGEMCYRNCVELSVWSEWSKCGAECGKGVMKRSLQPPTAHRNRRRNNDECYPVEETALCEVCPCQANIPSTSNYNALEKTIETYFVHEECQSAEIVRNKWCVGYCDDSYSLNVPTKWDVQTIRMVCSDGTVKFNNVAIIQECGCVNQSEDEFLYSILSG